MFETSTSGGKLQVDESAIRLVSLFKKVVWEIPLEQIIKLVRQPQNFLATNLVVRGTGCWYALGMIPAQKARELFELPALANTELIDVPAGSKWYQDIRLLSHLATYSSEKQANAEVAEAAKYGWHLDNVAGTAGHVNVGRTATAAVLTGGVSLLLGASRSKDKITLAFSRSADWMVDKN